MMQSKCSASNSLSEPWLEETGTQFQYRPLEKGAIRLVELQPSLLPEDPIRCNLIHADRREIHQYEVVSCSTSKPSVPISVNGQTFEAPPEIWDALRRIRLEDRSRILWINSICINKAHEAERNDQLSRLRDTYQYAAGVLIWLGFAENSSDLVFEHLDRCRKHIHINWCHYQGGTDEAFRRLCQRPYFYRSWSALELALTKMATVLCGHHQCDFSHLMKCSSFLSDTDYYHPVHGVMDSRTHLKHLCQISRGSASASAIFQWNRHCQADDPRDKVLASLLLDRGCVKFGIPIDYRQDTVRLFQIFTQKTIESCQTLEVLHWLGPQKKIDGLPSWVPDFSVVNPAGILPRVFGASATYSVHYPFKLLPGFEFRAGNVLALYGRFVEKIEKLGDELEGKDTSLPGSKNFNSVLEGWESLASRLANKRFPQAIIDAFSDTLTGNDEVDLVIKNDTAPFVRKTRPLSSRNTEQFSIWYRYYGTGILHGTGETQANAAGGAATEHPMSQNQERESEKSDKRRAEWLSRRMEMTCYGRRFFTTDKGTMGLAPPRAREGDDIVFFPGGRYPFVLRGASDGTYELLGDCFLYDLDVFALFQDEGVETLQFLIT
ncbi:heterokaryon incompatibility protein-domain-containing protein [Hypoxylon sp. NC1633]|nr:heterokaryon incompatibility protein-domain-containing protein [Hypoxylon sp. NC1633]